MEHGNIVYKALRRSGYIGKLYDIINLSYDKRMSVTESKDVLKEYLDKDYNLPIVRYFQWAEEASDEEKARDLAFQCSWYNLKFLSLYIDDSDELQVIYDRMNDTEDSCYDDEIIDDFVKCLASLNLCKNYIEWMETHASYDDLPSWVYMDFIRIVKNEWCIHFGSDAVSIARNGFTRRY